MKNKLGLLLRHLIFAFGVIYGVNVMLKNVNVYIPINVVTLGITTVLGIPGLLSLFAILFIIG